MIKELIAKAFGHIFFLLVVLLLEARNFLFAKGVIAPAKSRPARGTRRTRRAALVKDTRPWLVLVPAHALASMLTLAKILAGVKRPFVIGQLRPQSVHARVWHALFIKHCVVPTAGLELASIWALSWLYCQVSWDGCRWTGLSSEILDEDSATLARISSGSVFGLISGILAECGRYVERVPQLSPIGTLSYPLAPTLLTGTRVFAHITRARHVFEYIVVVRVANKQLVRVSGRVLKFLRNKGTGHATPDISVAQLFDVHFDGDIFVHHLHFVRKSPDQLLGLWDGDRVGMNVVVEPGKGLQARHVTTVDGLVVRHETAEAIRAWLRAHQAAKKAAKRAEAAAAAEANESGSSSSSAAAAGADTALVPLSESSGQGGPSSLPSAVEEETVG